MSADLSSDEPPSTEPSAWCLLGNIVDEHDFGESKDVLRGAKHFRPGSKVYCLPAQWGDGYESAIVVGMCRVSRRWITVVMRVALITNWRAKVVYHPAVLSRLRAGFDGWNRQWSSREDVEHWAELLRSRNGSA